MRVGLRQHSLAFWPRVLAPALTVAHEEPLFRRETVDGLSRRGRQRRDVGHQRNPQTAVVGGILAERQLAVHLDVVHRGEVRILVDDAGGPLLEAFGVGGRPPVLQVALRVELAPLVVEAVRQLVADHTAGGPVVQRRVGLGVVEGRLEDAGREVDVVLERVVIRVDRGRRHAPLALVERLPDAIHLAAELELVGALRVAERIAARDRQRTVVAPLVRVADLVGHGMKLDDRLLLGGIAHPRQAVDVLLHRGFELAHHLQRVLLGRRSEGFLHKGLAEHFAEIAVGVLDAPPPPRLQLFGSRERRTVEAEVLVDEGRGQHGGGPMREVPAEVGFEIGGRRRGHHGVERLEELGLGDVDRVNRRCADAFEVRGPVEGGRELLQLRRRHLVVERGGVAPRHGIEGRLGKCRFDAHHRAGRGRRIARIRSEQRDHLPDMFHVLLPQLDRLRVVAEVVVAIRQAESALVRDCADQVGFLEVGFGAEAEEDVHPHRVELGDELRQIARAGQGGDLLQRRLEGRRALRIDRVFVHARGVVVADLPGVNIRARVASGVFQDAAEGDVVAFLQLLAAAPRRSIGRNRLVLRPPSARELVEVHARIHRAIHERHLEAGCGSRGRRRLRRDQRRRDRQRDEKESSEAAFHHTKIFLCACQAVARRGENERRLELGG